MLVCDLFCGAGGASMGYHRAGFDVVGVDILPQKNYPFKFIQADALEVLKDIKADFIHASPPCQATCAITKGTNAGKYEYRDVYPQVRKMMEASGIPGVIENPSSRPDVVLCGEMFGLGVIRHRRFELVNWSAPQPVHIKHRGRVRGWRHGVWADGPYVGAYGDGGGRGSLEELKEAMDIPWVSSRKEIVEAIPPAYTAWIGGKFLSYRGEGHPLI